MSPGIARPARESRAPAGPARLAPGRTLAYTHIMDDALGAALAARRSEVLAACACTNLRKATRAVTQRFDTALRPSGLRATQLALLLACAGPDDANLGEIAERLAVDRSTLSRTL